MMPNQDFESTCGASPISTNVRFANWRPGDIIDGRLEIQELIGKGGMGVVWRVHHREWNRELAVKMPLPALVGSPTARDRFLREAETWIDLGVHPHIVQCWFVMDISGLPSLFLDYLTGGSLKQWIDAGHVKPGQWKRILEIAIQVCEGMAYAHSRGVIHRDIKPANLLIRGDERVCVTDFGIVKTANSVDQLVPSVPLNTGLPQTLSITGTGAFLGTPQYGAPEQWGSAEEVDVGADIYALGVTLYEMCCGRRPFDAEDEHLAPEVLIDRHLTVSPQDPREFFPDVPADLARVALLCLEKDPRRRPQSMLRLQETLSSIYKRLVGRAYEGVGSIPSEQRPDTLNNRAVSLHSLAKRDDAVDVWRRGLRIESGHPECLYNLTQYDKRAGKIDSEEALRRLRQARAGLPLALLCIEEGQAQEAVEVLQDIKVSEGTNHGPTQRALGDAYMYTQQYYAAEKAYRSALTSMPADTGSQERKRLANLGKRSLAGKYLFPSSDSTFRIVVPDPSVVVAMTKDSTGVIGVTKDMVTHWNIEEQSVHARVERDPSATQAKHVRVQDDLLLIEDQDAFELRRLPDLTLLGRKSGRLIAVTRNLAKMIVSDRGGVFLFDVKCSSLNRLKFGPEITGTGRLLACFDQNQDQVCLLLPTGQIAQPDEENQVIPEAWPKTVDDCDDVSAMVLSHSGATLYLGHSSGRIQALQFEKQSTAFELHLPFPVIKLELAKQSRHLIVSMNPGFVVIDKYGRVVCQGDSIVEVDWKRDRCLTIHQSQLELFDLKPFRKLRTWRQQIARPRQLVLASDGRLAASLDHAGSIDIWEVDEDHRVFERSFLLSPGRSYAEIINASQRFNASLTQAQEALQRDQVASSYRHLQRARSVEGYAQAPNALDLNWELLTSLRRGRLEAVWERLSLAGDDPGERPGPIDLSDGGHHLLVSFGRRATFFHDTGSVTSKIWAHGAKFDILGLKIVDQNPVTGQAVIVDKQGHGGVFRLSDGNLEKTIRLDKGQLKQIEIRDRRLYFFTNDGALGVFNLQTETIEFFAAHPEAKIRKFFPGPGDTVIVALETGFGTLNLGKKKAKISLMNLKGTSCVSNLCYAKHVDNPPLVILGFDDGSIIICDVARHRPVFQLAQAASSAVTGFGLVPQLSMGVASTRKGELLFLDLHSGSVLGEFLAHRGRIIDLHVSTTGRYLATSSSGGNVRLWETSWTANEEEQEPVIEWLPTPTTLTKLSNFLRFSSKSK